MSGKTLFYTLTLFCFLMALQGCQSSPPILTVEPQEKLTPSPAPSATGTPSFTLSLSPTLKAQPFTLTLDPEEQVRQFLEASPYDFQSGRGYITSAVPYGVRGLEYLVYLSPRTNYRKALIETILNNAFGYNILDLDWLQSIRMQTVLLDPINATGQVSLEFQSHWAMTETDLDADKEPDYIFRVPFRRDIADMTPGIFYWLYQKSGVYELTPIARYQNIYSFEILFLDDKNNNGLPDLVTQAFICGGSDCIVLPFIYDLQIGFTTFSTLPFEWSARDWEVHEKNGKLALVGMFIYADLNYKIMFENIDGVLIPVDVDAHPESTFEKILWSDLLTELGLPQRALDVLLSQENWDGIHQSSQSYLDYVLFRIGMLNLYLDQAKEAKAVWQRIVLESPNSPIASKIPELLPLLEQPAPLWKVCNWLISNQITWYPADFDQEKYPYTFSIPYDWYSMCSFFTLVHVQKWEITQTIAQQSDAIGLSWTLLSSKYDLNQDSIPDPIGELGNWLWVFLSNNTTYTPILIGPQWSQQTIWINPYSAIETNQYGEIKVFQESPNSPNWPDQIDRIQTVKYEWTGKFYKEIIYQTRPYTLTWLELIGQYQTTKYVWTGRYFKVVGGYQPLNTIFLEPPDRKNHLTQAILALFRDQNPARALELLQTYTSEDEWETLTARYVTAIALKYNGQADLARSLFESIIADYPDTGWAKFSREHLQDSK